MQNSFLSVFQSWAVHKLLEVKFAAYKEDYYFWAHKAFPIFTLTLRHRGEKALVLLLSLSSLLTIPQQTGGAILYFCVFPQSWKMSITSGFIKLTSDRCYVLFVRPAELVTSRGLRIYHRLLWECKKSICQNRVPLVSPACTANFSLVLREMKTHIKGMNWCPTSL